MSKGIPLASASRRMGGGHARAGEWKQRHAGRSSHQGVAQSCSLEVAVAQGARGVRQPPARGEGWVMQCGAPSGRRSGACSERGAGP